MEHNLRHLRIFLSIAAHNSVTKAAELHHLSQPAVTQALNKLEQRTGAPLFHRTPQGLFVSELGRLFARRVERALAHLDAATASLAPRLKLTATVSQLQALIAVHEAENFTLAARRLGISQPSNACFHTTGAHYINADTTAVMQLIEGDLFKDFPTLRFVIPHGGGAAPYHWGRYRGLAQVLKKPLLREHLLKNVFFDTCVYHQPGIDLLSKVIPVENILFASEMIGAVRGIDPETGHNFDDTRRYVEATPHLSDAERRMIFEANARRVYPRLDAALKARRR